MATTTRCAYPRRPPAFSLLELAMVLAVIAVVAAIAAPRYSHSLERWRVDTAARLVASDLALAGVHARATSTPTPVVFDSAALSYQITGLRDLKTGSVDRVVRLDQPTRLRNLAADFGGDATLVFDGFGVPDTDGQVVLSCGSHSRIVAVESGGKVVIR